MAIKQNDSSLAYLALAAVLGGLWFGSTWVTKKLNALPVRELQQVESAQAVIPDNLTFYPAVAKVKYRGANSANATAVDEVFKSPELPKDDVAQAVAPKAVPAPKYGELLSQRAELQSIADNGAVINGQYFQVGQAMEGLPVTNASGQVVIPRLTSVSPSAATVNVGGDIVHLSFAKRVGHD